MSVICPGDKPIEWFAVPYQRPGQSWPSGQVYTPFIKALPDDNIAVPVGTIIGCTDGVHPPRTRDGGGPMPWLPCDGRKVTKGWYPDLAAALSTQEAQEK